MKKKAEVKWTAKGKGVTECEEQMDYVDCQRSEESIAGEGRYMERKLQKLGRKTRL